MKTLLDCTIEMVFKKKPEFGQAESGESLSKEDRNREQTIVMCVNRGHNLGLGFCNDNLSTRASRNQEIRNSYDGRRNTRVSPGSMICASGLEEFAKAFPDVTAYQMLRKGRPTRSPGSDGRGLNRGKALTRTGRPNDPFARCPCSQKAKKAGISCRARGRTVGRNRITIWKPPPRRVRESYV
jgi:hypothetical protein